MFTLCWVFSTSLYSLTHNPNRFPFLPLSPVQKITTADVVLVQLLIERCLQLYMSPDEIRAALQTQVRVQSTSHKPTPPPRPDLASPSFPDHNYRPRSPPSSPSLCGISWNPKTKAFSARTRCDSRSRTRSSSSTTCSTSKPPTRCPAAGSRGGTYMTRAAYLHYRTSLLPIV